MLSLSVISQKNGKTFETSKGWAIAIGDKIKLGTGSGPNGVFRFIKVWGAAEAIEVKTTSNMQINKVVDKTYKHEEYEVSKIYDDNAIVVKRGLGRLLIDVEPAIQTGELTVPANYNQQGGNVIVIKENEVSVADELVKLKKLYDDGVISKKEYKAQKKKLLKK